MLTPNVVIYTDGACLGNPGRGGYGVIVETGGKHQEISGGFRLTTNNRMEIMAAICGLESLRESSEVAIFSDSQYLVRAMTEGWVYKWRKQGWMRNSKDHALNVDLWVRLLQLCQKHQVKFYWVRGHNNQAQNERCDTLANESAKKENLLPDAVYESF
ncbi:MAG: ribonuclease HI [Dehalococcoidia bacterium]|nr:ribonuclease HI [Dehalococcoidia bacterium]